MQEPKEEPPKQKRKWEEPKPEKQKQEPKPKQEQKPRQPKPPPLENMVKQLEPPEFERYFTQRLQEIARSVVQAKREKWPSLAFA